MLFNALVTYKRVVFLGHGLAAGKVADHVLAACALASGCGSVLSGFTERAFPYTNLTNLDNLETVYVQSVEAGETSRTQLTRSCAIRPAFIAGVCNPAFAERPSWWDVLCNIETGKITVSKHIDPPQPFSRTVTKTNASGGIENAVSPDETTIGSGLKGALDSPDHAFMDEVSLLAIPEGLPS